MYYNAHPTKTASDPTGPYRLCISCGNADGRVQQECFEDTVCNMSESQVANFKIMKPSAGTVGEVTVSTTGWHCVRIYVAGKNSSATVQITHP